MLVDHVELFVYACVKRGFRLSTNVRRYQVSMAMNKSQTLSDVYGNEEIMDVIRFLSGCRLFSKRNQMFILLLACSLTQCLELPALLHDELEGSSLLDQLALVHHKYLGTGHDGLVSVCPLSVVLWLPMIVALSSDCTLACDFTTVSVLLV